ncbi:MAG: carbohydrate binding family 9 domain-containing protein, partial [Woeseiaceae bacterium]
MVERRKDTCRCLAVALVLSAATPAIGESPSVAAATGVPAGAVTLDGRLDEGAWREAEVIVLTQQEPRPGAPTPFVTEVRVLADVQHLYFGFANSDPVPGSVAVHTLQRDDDQEADDHVTVVLDTFGARRLGYWFQVNAGGARADGLNVNDNTDDNWNGIWDAAVERTSSGWTAEIEISTQSIQFNSNLEAWGLNLGRYVARDQLSLRWAGITLDSDIFDLRRAGALLGIGDLKQGLGLAIQPYALARYNSAPGADQSGDLGADVKYSFT